MPVSLTGIFYAVAEVVFAPAAAALDWAGDIPIFNRRASSQSAQPRAQPHARQNRQLAAQTRLFV